MEKLSKRIKIKTSISKGEYKVIPPEKIYESNKRIKEKMKKFKKKYKQM